MNLNLAPANQNRTERCFDELARSTPHWRQPPTQLEIEADRMTELERMTPILSEESKQWSSFFSLMLLRSSYNCSSASAFSSFGNTFNAISYSGSCCPCLKQHSNSKSGVKYGTSGLVQRHLSRLISMRGMGVRTTDIREVSNQSKTTNNETLVSFENATFGTDYHTSLAQEYGKHPPGFTGNTIQF